MSVPDHEFTGFARNITALISEMPSSNVSLSNDTLDF